MEGQPRGASHLCHTEGEAECHKQTPPSGPHVTRSLQTLGQQLGLPLPEGCLPRKYLSLIPMGDAIQLRMTAASGLPPWGSFTDTVWYSHVHTRETHVPTCAHQTGLVQTEPGREHSLKYEGRCAPPGIVPKVLIKYRRGAARTCWTDEYPQSQQFPPCPQRCSLLESRMEKPTFPRSYCRLG